MSPARNASTPTHPITVQFATNMGALRRLRGLTVEDLAAALGPDWTRNLLGCIERHERDVTIAEAHTIATYFGLTVDTMATTTIHVTMQPTTA